MDRYLLVSGSQKGADYFLQFLTSIQDTKVDSIDSAGETRRLLICGEYDYIIINSPLSDESGIELAKDIVSVSDSPVLLLVHNSASDSIRDDILKSGIFMMEKPLSRQMLYSCLNFMKAAANRMAVIKSSRDTLKKRIEDIKIIDRAKYCLIEYLKMTEPQAHRHIEKQAMDLRRSKRQISEDIIKTYEM